MANQWKIGDRIAGRYKIFHILGGVEGHGGIHSGMGIVYVVYDDNLDMVWALKTFQDQFLKSEKTRDAFRQEALTWIEMGNYPYIVHAHYVEEISGRLFIKMEYITPNQDKRNCLVHYLNGEPLPLEQTLRWAIQFCHGMEYVYSKGVLCHRDIKPENIMITFEGTLKITDFGLAGAIDSDIVIEDTDKINILEPRENIHKGLSLIRIGKGVICGTPGYIAPEVLKGNGANQLSDLFSFGVVLYQMASGDYQSPFFPFLNEPCGVEKLSKLDSPLWPVIRRCLALNPDSRYMNFAQLRSQIEALLKNHFGTNFIVPDENVSGLSDLANIGNSLVELNLPEKAIYYFDKALKINQGLASIWSNKGRAFAKMGKHEEAIDCYDKSISLDLGEPTAWSNKGLLLAKLNRPHEAISCNENAVNINPRSPKTWVNMGLTLEKLERYDEAIRCYEKALRFDPGNSLAWNNKANVYYILRQPQKALECSRRALEINPKLAIAWDNKGNALWMLGRMEEAINSYDRSLDIDPGRAQTYVNKGNALMAIERFEQAISWFDKALKINSNFSDALNKKGMALGALGRIKEALTFFEKAKYLGDPNADENIQMCREILRMQ